MCRRRARTRKYRRRQFPRAMGHCRYLSESRDRQWVNARRPAVRAVTVVPVGLPIPLVRPGTSRAYRPAGRPWQNQRVQIRMLGPLEVLLDDGAPADVPGARLRGVLAALALRPGQVVPKASLIDWIWGEQPPADAAGALQRLVSRLRKALPDEAIDGQPEGYRLRAEPDAV